MDTLAIIAIDLVAITLLTFGIYFRRHRRRDLVVAYLVVNIGVLAVTVVASLVSPAGRAHSAIANSRNSAKKYISGDFSGKGETRDEVYGLVVAHERALGLLTAKHRAQAAEDEELNALLAEAHELHRTSSN